MGKVTLYQITDDIYFDERSVFLIKIIEHTKSSEPEFCYADSREEAEQLIERLTNQLVTELTRDPQLAGNKTKITVERANRSFIIRTQTLGYFRNGTPTPIYTLSYNEVCHGFMKTPSVPVSLSPLAESEASVNHLEAPVTEAEAEAKVEDPLDKLIAELKVILDKVGTIDDD